MLEKVQRDLRFQIRKDFQRPRVIFFERYLDLIKQPSFVPPQPVMIPGEHLKLLRLFGVGLKSTQMNVIGSKKFRQHISVKGITLGLAHAKAISGPIQGLGVHRYVDPEGQFVFRYVGTQQQGNIAYNSKLVNPKEIRSLWDLVDARWKGKIIARDVRVPGPGSAPMRFFYLHPAIGPAFIKKLFGEMDVTLFRDFRQSIDWLASGKASLCFFCADAEKAKLQGLPVEEFANFKEGAPLVTQYGTLALLNRAPHANAAKVFINWFLSRDGQIALQKSIARSGAETADSLRIDILKDDVKPENRRAPGVNYLDIDSQIEWTEMKPVLAIFEEALANAEKQKK